MSRQAIFASLRISSLLFLSLGLVGCHGSSGEDNVDKEKRHILRVAQLTQDYSATTKKRPGSIDDVKNWAVKEDKATEDEFISPRDQQPYGLTSGMMGLSIYEQTGKNGKCFLYSTGTVREVSPEELTRMKNLGSTRRGGPPK